MCVYYGNGGSKMAKLSYKGTGKRCKEKILSSDRSYTHQCKEDASRGSEYCLRHKHMRKHK